MVLRGVLERAFGNILCLRGFARLGDLENLSVPDESYQRTELESHSKEIAEFLDSGEYTFFPEVILGASLKSMGFSYEDASALNSAVKDGIAFKKRSDGGVYASTFVKRFKRGGEPSFHITAIFHNLKEALFSRIDGNHRLQAVKNAPEKVKNFLAPFCLVFFQDDEERQRFGRVFFHMINFRAKQISEEHNLRLILDEEDFDDERLLKTPFGPEFFLARLCLRNDEIRNSWIKCLSYVNLIKILRCLINAANTAEDKNWDETTRMFDKITRDIKDQFLGVFYDKTRRLDNLLANNSELSEMCMSDENILASLVLMSYRTGDMSGYIAWLISQKRKEDLKALGLSFDKIVEIFDAGLVERQRTIFVSMQFGSCGTEQNYKTIEKVVDELNTHYGLTPSLKIVRVDQVMTGKTFEINEKIINEVAQCGYLIADLTYCNSNVYHEIGMLMGRTLALTGKHEYNMSLILDRQVSQENKIVKFNLQSLQHFAFSKQEELENGIKERLVAFYKL